MSIGYISMIDSEIYQNIDKSIKSKRKLSFNTENAKLERFPISIHLLWNLPRELYSILHNSFLNLFVNFQK